MSAYSLGRRFAPGAAAVLRAGDRVAIWGDGNDLAVTFWDVVGAPPELRDRGEALGSVPDWLRAKGPNLVALLDAEWESLAELTQLVEPDEAVDDEGAWIVDAPQPVVLSEQLLQDLADRRGFAVGSHEPADPRSLDEPLVMLHADTPPDPEESEPWIARVRELECELAGLVLAHHFGLWERFVAQYPRRLDEQPPSAADALALAATCAGVLARRDRTSLAGAVQARLSVGVRARLCLWLAHEPPERIAEDLRVLLVEARELRERIVLTRVRFASAASGDYWHRGLSWRVRMPIAVAAVSRALDTYDPAKPASFGTYARQWIMSMVGRAANECGQRARQPQYLVDLRLKLTRELRSAVADGRGLEWTPTLVDQLLEACGHNGLRRVTLEAALAPTSLDGSSRLERIPPTPSELAAAREAWGALLAAIAAIPKERTRDVVRERLGLDEERRSLADIGTDADLSRERIRQLERDGKQQLWVTFGRRMLESGYGAFEGSTSPTSSASPSSSS